MSLFHFVNFVSFRRCNISFTEVQSIFEFLCTQILRKKVLWETFIFNSNSKFSTKVVFFIRGYDIVIKETLYVYWVLGNWAWQRTHMSSVMTKSTEWHVRPAKTRISLGIRPVCSLIRVFAVRIKKAWVLSYPSGAQQRLWSDWANAQAGLSLHWAHRSFCWFCHEEAHIMLAIIMIHGERRLLLLPDTVEVYCMSNNSFLWWMLCEVFYLQTQNCFHLAPQTPAPTEWNTIKKGISV